MLMGSILNIATKGDLTENWNFKIFFTTFFDYRSSFAHCGFKAHTKPTRDANQSKSAHCWHYNASSFPTTANMTAELHTSRDDSTLIIRIDGPESRNALHPDMVGAVIEILSTAERDDSVRAIILTGANQIFSAGTDLRHLKAIRAREVADQIDSFDGMLSWMETLRNCTKPTIAAVEGLAAGSGLALALSCDLIVAGTSARLMACNALAGLTPDAGLSWILSRTLPRQLASEMLLIGEAMSAARLHALGLVNLVVADGTAMDAALHMADTLAALAPNVTTETRVLLAEAQGQSLAQHCAGEKHRFVESLQHRNALEGMAAFLAKRKPEFK